MFVPDLEASIPTRLGEHKAAGLSGMHVASVEHN